MYITFAISDGIGGGPGVRVGAKRGAAWYLRETSKQEDSNDTRREGKRTRIIRYRKALRKAATLVDQS